jgi:hypothetical protein
LQKSGQFILVDRTTNVVLELDGPNLASQAGNRVEIAGRAETVKPHVPGATQVIAVAGLKMVARGGCSPVAKKAGASASAAAAGDLPGQGDPPPSASR